MKTLLVALNSKYIHSSYALHILKAICPTVICKEYSINMHFDEIFESLYEYKADCYGFSVYIWNERMVILLAEQLKKINPNCQIFFAGEAVSHDDHILQTYPFVDFIINGEGEQQLKEFMSGVKISEIPGISYRDHGRIKRNGLDKFLALTEIPFPYSVDNFSDVAELSLSHKIIYYETQRGCPFHCSYCNSPGTKMRFLSEERVKSDLTFFLNQNVKQVKFLDRTFNANKKHALFIWKFLIENDNLVSNFHFEIMGDLLDSDMMELLKKARPGQFQFEIGVQSSNRKTLFEITRKTNLEKLKENVCALTQQHRIHIHLDLIAGLPYETFASFRQSFQFVFSMKSMNIQLGFLKLLKGSALRKKATEYGIIYQSQAPNEILCNPWISFPELCRLKKIEKSLNFFYNSALLKHTLMYLNCFIEAFDVLEHLFDILYTTNLNKRERKAVCLDIENHLLKLPGNYDKEIVRNLIMFDLLLQDQEFLALEHKKKMKISLKNQEKYEHIMKKYDIMKSKKFTAAYELTMNPITHRMEKTILLFDYANRSPIDHTAGYYFLEEENV